MPKEKLMDALYYHFLPSQFAIDDLAKQRIKVSTIDTLNDPFEMNPYMRCDDDIRPEYREERSRICDNYGLLCFCHDWRETLLWSYYADKHRGIAIGFDIPSDDVIEVCYTLNPTRQRVELTDNPREVEKQFLDLAKVKYGEWMHEREARVLVERKDWKDEPVDKCGKQALYRFRHFDNRLQVKAIVLGCRFPYSKAWEDILREAKKLEAWIVPTREAWEGYKIRLRNRKAKPGTSECPSGSPSASGSPSSSASPSECTFLSPSASPSAGPSASPSASASPSLSADEDMPND